MCAVNAYKNLITCLCEDRVARHQLEETCEAELAILSQERFCCIVGFVSTAATIVTVAVRAVEWQKQKRQMLP